VKVIQKFGVFLLYGKNLFYVFQIMRISDKLVRDFIITEKYLLTIHKCIGLVVKLGLT